MLISEYQAGLAGVIDHFSGAGLIVSAEFSADIRTPKIGVIKG